jgi:hypothetical protein
MMRRLFLAIAAFMALLAAVIVVALGGALAGRYVSSRLTDDSKQQLSSPSERHDEETTEQNMKALLCGKINLKEYGTCSIPEEWDAGSEPSVVCYATSRAAVEPGKTECWDGGRRWRWP